MDGRDAYRTAELAEIYDAVYESVDDAGFWQAMAERSSGGPLLDLACGTGRVLLPLARAGYEIWGVDLSPHMLERCRTKLDAESPATRERVSLVLGDMTSFNLGSRFGAILCAFNSFHHLRTVEQQLACLRKCREHLLPGGVLVLDLFNPDPASPVPGEAGSLGEAAAPEPDTNVLLADWTEGRQIRRWMSSCEYDRTLQCNECEMTYEVIEADGTISGRLVEEFPLRIIYRYELEHLLARSGLGITASYGGYDGSPFSEESLGMIVVAERVG
jgi:SAM-dependent methyltransferase